MPIRRVPRSSPAMVVAVIALIAAVSGNAIAHVGHGGGAAAAAKPKVKPAAKNSVGSSAVIDNSLLLKDFKSSERKKLAGPRGATGAAGATGPTGPTGTPDTSSFYDKPASDGRFLAKTAQAADSAALGSVPAAGYTTGGGSQNGAFEVVTTSDTAFLAIGSIAHLEVFCATSPTIRLVNDSSSEIRFTNNLELTGTFPTMSGQSLAGATSLYTNTFTGGGGQVVMQAHRFASAGSTATDDATIIASVIHGADSASSCRFTANYVLSHHG